MTTNVFIVDDSATARTALRLILETSEDINVIGVASNPLIALKRMNTLWPDVIISDLEMPEMNGAEFLGYIKKNHPTPFIIFSNYTGSNAKSSVEVLSKGAADIIAKPDFSCPESLDETRNHILNSIRAAANISVPAKLDEIKANQKLVDVPLKQDKFSMIAIGSSTGGTSIIEKILRQVPTTAPGVVIVQHMPEHFTKAFANRINQFCSITVKEAEDGDEVVPGVALIAPGGRHMKVVGRAPNFRVSISDRDADYVNRHKPSVDVLFDSVAEIVRKGALGIILTGMGKDGAKGMLAMKNTGAETISQAAEDCAVYGMPKAAMALGAVNHSMRTQEIVQMAAKIKARG